MDISKFYDFGSKLMSVTFQAAPIGLKNEKTKNSDYDDEDKLLLGIYDDIDFPVIFKQDYGKKIFDILDTGLVSLFLISTKMKDILQENNLTGWKTFPAKVFDKKNKEVEGYHGLSILGRCGPIDYSKSKIIEKRLVPDGPLCKYYKGLFIGLDKWDGSDFFLAQDYFGIMVTSKAADVLKNNNLTNIQLQSLSEIETDVD